MNLLHLETARLTLQPPKLEDAENWYAVESEVKPISKAVINQWLQHHIQDFQKFGFSMGSVYLKETNEFIGRAGLFYYFHPESDNFNIELGYVLHKAHWNQGYATELAKALVDWGFENLHIDKIVALTRPDNIASQRILQKIGMHYQANVQAEGEDFFLYEIKK